MRSVLACAGAAAVVAAPHEFNVLSFGADPSGKALSTTAFEQALASIEAVDGGILYVPPGTYLLSPINFTTSNTELRLDAATLLATDDFSAWNVIAPLPSYGRGRDFPGPRYDSFLHFWNVSHVRITSNSSTPGYIDGQGARWWAAVVGKKLDITPGHLVEFLWSDHIEIDNVHFVDSPFWTVHVAYSSYVWAHDFQVTAPIHSTNTDGFDPDSTSHVLIERANITTGDDCIAIKAGWAPWAVWHDGQRGGYSVPTVNVTIRDLTCRTQSGCIAVGSEMSGGVSDVHASRVSCVQAGQGLNVKSALGRGGYITNVTLADSTFGLPGCKECVVGVAIAGVDTYTDQYPAAPVNVTLVPQLRDITVVNVTALGPPGSLGGCGVFEGLGGSGNVTGVRLIDVDLSSGYAGKAPWRCTNTTGTSVNVKPQPCAELAAAPGKA